MGFAASLLALVFSCQRSSRASPLVLQPLLWFAQSTPEFGMGTHQQRDPRPRCDTDHRPSWAGRAGPSPCSASGAAEEAARVASTSPA